MKGCIEKSVLSPIFETSAKASPKAREMRCIYCIANEIGAAKGSCYKSPHGNHEWR